MSNIAPPVRPDLRTLLRNSKQETFENLNCHLLGTITAIKIQPEFVPRVSVQIASKKILPDGTTIDYPLLTDVPVFVLSGGKAFIQMPISVGDDCLVLFHDTDIDNWWVTGNSTPPNTPRSHSLSDGMALVGFPNMAKPLAGDSPGSIYIFNDNQALSLDPTFGLTVNVHGAGGNTNFQMLPNGGIQLTNFNGASFVYDLLGNFSLQNGSGLTLASGSAGTLTMHNSTASLRTALDALFTALTSWVNTGGSTPNPATVTAINAVKTSIDALLY